MVATLANDSHMDEINFKQKYRNLKRKLKYLIYENECFQEELKKAQRKLLKVNRDKSFLLDRLLQYERVEDSSSDSEDTESSDGESDGHKLEAGHKKRGDLMSTGVFGSSGQYAGATGAGSGGSGGQTKPAGGVVKKKRPTVKIQKQSSGQQSFSTTVALSQSSDGHMTPEEVERHLESRQSLLSLLPERAPPTVPTEMFSNDPSSLDSEFNEVGEGETSPSNIGDDGLAIDLPE